MPKSEGSTDEQKKVEESAFPIHRLKRERAILKSYGALGVKRNQSIQLIDTFIKHEPGEVAYRTLGVCRLVYYPAKQHKKTIDVHRMILRIKGRKLLN